MFNVCERSDSIFIRPRVVASFGTYGEAVAWAHKNLPIVCFDHDSDNEGCADFITKNGNLYVIEPAGRRLTSTKANQTKAKPMSIHQAIETHYSSGSIRKPPRVIATTYMGHRYDHFWDDALTYFENHYAAAEALRDRLDWPAIKAGCATAKGCAFATSTLED
jgi:hypothetical protein